MSSANAVWFDQPFLGGFVARKGVYDKTGPGCWRTVSVHTSPKVPWWTWWTWWTWWRNLRFGSTTRNRHCSRRRSRHGKRIARRTRRRCLQGRPGSTRSRPSCGSGSGASWRRRSSRRRPPPWGRGRYQRGAAAGYRNGTVAPAAWLVRAGRDRGSPGSVVDFRWNEPGMAEHGEDPFIVPRLFKRL